MSDESKPAFKLPGSTTEASKDPNPTTNVMSTTDNAGATTEIKTTPAAESPSASTEPQVADKVITDDDFDFSNKAAPVETAPNPNAVKFGTREVNIGGMTLRMPATAVHEDFGDYTDEGFAKPIAAFKHHTVKRFQVGKHDFHNHILQIFNEADLADFLRCWEGLQGPDQVNITQYDWEAAAKMHSPVSDLIARGSMSTKGIKDPKQVA